MKKTIRNISIDGIEKTGKTSVFRQLKSILKEKGVTIESFSNPDSLDDQLQVLENTKNIVLRENSILSLLYDRFKMFEGVSHVEEIFTPILDKEKKMNWKYGCVHFFLVPTTASIIAGRFEKGEPYYLTNLVNFFKNINQYSIVQGLNVKILVFDENDFIFDIADKIVKELEAYSF
jgi:hypothetical protein